MRLVLYTVWMDKLGARKPMVEKDVFLILAVIFLLLFWTLPWAIGSGGWINERLHLFVILLLLVVNAFS